MDIYYKRIEIYNDTVTVANLYFNDIPESIKYYNDLEIDNNFDTVVNGEITIEKIDSIDAAIILINKGLNPVLLNMADPSMPGGCINMGASAQEENIFRRSNYFKTLDMKFYPLLQEENIYSKDVTIFRSEETDNIEESYLFIDPVKISIIASASVRHPAIKYSGDSSEDSFKDIDDYNLQFAKIENIFVTAIREKHDSIVLSAFGCGAFKCPPKVVAEMFKENINRYSKYFKCIFFAIKQPVDNQSKNNYEIFSKVLFDFREIADPNTD